jgi:hypothetical protein
MDVKLLASIVLCLIVGTGIGYSVSLPQISILQSKTSSLESEISTLTTDYNNLNASYNQLLNDYNSLNSTYYNLQKTYEQLEKAYEILNTAGLVFNGLRISDLNVTTEYWWSTYYDVMGNVTNISNQSMSKVYIVLFTFEPDGTLDYYYVRTVENLAVNESNDFEFSGVLEENQKFNILAIGNHGFADIESDEAARLLALLEEAEARIVELEQMVEYEVYALKDEEYYYSIMDDVKEANETILVAMYSMIYDPNDTFDWANDLIKELVYAKQRGVNVTAIIEYRTYWGYMDENLEAYNYLSAYNVNVQLDIDTDTDHMKLVIIDNNIVYVGSHNWSESGLYYNHETSVKIVSKEIAELFKAYFETI